MVITSNKPFFKQKKENQHYEISYGTIKKGSDSKVKVLFKDTAFLTNNRSCSCTEPTIELLGEDFEVNISYNTNKVGTINQWVKIKTTKGEVKIDLKGQVV